MAGLKKKHALVTTEKKEAPKKQGSKKQKDFDGINAKSLSSWSLQPALIGLLVSVVLSVALEMFFVRALEGDHQRDVSKTFAELVQRDLNFMVEERLAVIKAASESQDLIDHLTNGTKANHDLLHATFPDLVDYFVIPVLKIPQVRALYPNLRFASVDAIRKAKPIEDLQIEAFFDGEKWFYQAALQINGNDGVVVLFLFDDSELKRALTIQAASLNGSVAIYGSSEPNAVKVMQIGGDPHGEFIKLPVNVGAWELRYAPTKRGLFDVDRTMLWISLISAALLVLVFTYVICKFRLERVSKDVLLASTFILSGIKGDRKKPDRLNYAETISLVKRANEALSETDTTKPGAESAHAEEDKSADSAGRAEQSAPMEVQEAHSDDDDLNFDDLDLDEELGLNESVNDKGSIATRMGAEESDGQGVAPFQIDQSIFRAYDIRGIVDEALTLESVEMIGKAFASEALSQGQNTICVGYDGRLSSEDYCQAICRGITGAGADAIIVGMVPTPVLYFATHHLNTGTGMMITGSHNPSNYNGFKMMIGGNTLSGDAIQSLYQRIATGNMLEGDGLVSEQSINDAYLETIVNDVAVAAPLKVVLDAGNGVAGELAPKLVQELGCEVIPLFCDIDGTFPNHHPDPGKPQNLEDLIKAVEEHDADLGLAFDGDGDRVGVVTNSGKIIWPDRLLMLFAKDVVSRNPGADIIYDVKCSRRLNGLISGYGGRAIMWKTGHSLIKAKMKETGALLAGEMSGHIFFKERWFGFDDGLYSAVRLLEILGIEDRPADDVFADFPEDLSTPEINITVSEDKKFELIEKLCGRAAAFEDGSVSTIDGLRVDFADGWGLCRASNTTPVLVLRFEADDEPALKRIQERFKDQLREVDSTLDLGF